MVRIQNMRVQSFLTAAAINLKRLARFCERPPKARFVPDLYGADVIKLKIESAVHFDVLS
jgi:hypothetical protein